MFQMLYTLVKKSRSSRSSRPHARRTRLTLEALEVREVPSATHLGVVRPSASGSPTFSLDSNGNGVFDANDAVFSFGLNGDTFIVGDWNGNGKAKIGVVRPNADGTAQVILDTNGDGVYDSGDQVFNFGLASDTFIVGDWNGDGRSKVGVVRPTASGVASISLDSNGDHVFDAGDQVFSFGLNTDTFITGKWKQPASTNGSSTSSSKTTQHVQQSQVSRSTSQVHSSNQTPQLTNAQLVQQYWQTLSPQQQVQVYYELTGPQLGQLFAALSSQQLNQLERELGSNSQQTSSNGVSSLPYYSTGTSGFYSGTGALSDQSYNYYSHNQAPLTYGDGGLSSTYPGDFS